MPTRDGNLAIVVGAGEDMVHITTCYWNTESLHRVRLGVIGLTTAITLLEVLPHVQCTIIAECMPGDNKSVEYASPWAGAHLVSHAKHNDPEMAACDRAGLEVFMRQYTNQETDSLKLIDQFEYYLEGADNGSDPEGLRSIGMPELRELCADELPNGVVAGLTFKTLTIDTSAYLHFLSRRFESLGGNQVRAKLGGLHEASDLPRLQKKPCVIFNCTGLGSLTLEDVKDESMYPVRGQLCLVKAPWMHYGKTFSGKGFTSYSIPRSSGIVVVGGTRDAHDWFGLARPETSRNILERAVHFDRNLLPPDKRQTGTYLDLHVVEEGCGRRPARKGGVRIEISNKSVDDVPVVHNYGHAGFGWQTSWGYAQMAVNLALHALT